MLGGCQEVRGEDVREGKEVREIDAEARVSKEKGWEEGACMSAPA